MNKPLLEVKHLVKKFNDNIVLNDINFAVNKSDVIVILGSSGCGKSTLLRCINGLEGTDEGEIIFGGKTINTPSTNWTLIRQKIGMVFQSYELFPHMNVIDNITLAPIKVEKRPKDEVLKDALILLERFNLSDKKDSMPRFLSGGQKQRVAIIRALCMNPEILLFDEVTASLDPEMAYEVSNVILELAKDGMTMIIVTHEMKFAQSIASQIIFLDNGVIAESALPNDFFNNPKSSRAKKFLSIFDVV
ncbi:glutamine ABC transporter ATP-binding protein [Helicobacter sp. 16-1353]|uniref:amino acid ABC transporter ATP-binding protein n=1 Tax=Helicobacter sp. 16-1353 TaxID=2004996 RepID=UPI000DCEF164|nr:amino acid ABC transporter ATP-binding protein [Helicobacter sp. 16-1353]RAX51719.1 glutamine ABC transporter ATP-binding protein [Helicobacter sp. 16-1353]